MKTKIKFAICSVVAIISIVITNYGDEIRTSKAGLELIGNAEACMREPYYCPAGILTIGIGSTSGSIENRTYTDAEIAARWVSDIKETEQCVNKYGNGKALPQPVFDSVVSLTFNVGCTKMRSSTMYTYLNTNELTKACNEFPRWRFSNGIALDGLSKRRTKEQRHCLTGTTQ